VTNEFWWNTEYDPIIIDFPTFLHIENVMKPVLLHFLTFAIFVKLSEALFI
jgi:hypothetical protein